MGGTRKFYDTQVYNPADGALGHLDVSFADYPTTDKTVAKEGTLYASVVTARDVQSRRGRVWAEHGSSTTHKFITLRTAPWGI